MVCARMLQRMFSWESATLLFEFLKHLLYIFKTDLVMCLFIYSLIHIHGLLFISDIKIAI